MEGCSCRGYRLALSTSMSFRILFGTGYSLKLTDDFEVAVFLTETSTRHSILRKEKRAKTESGRLGTTNGRLTGTKDTPVEVGENTPGLRREESDDEGSHVRLANVPVAGGDSAKEKAQLADEGSHDRLFVSDEDEDEGSRAGIGDGGGNSSPRTARDRGEQDDKKKLALNTTYDGFSIYGRILCLVVKRRDTSKSKSTIGSAGPAMMEDWIASTQMGEGQLMDE